MKKNLYVMRLILSLLIVSLIFMTFGCNKNQMQSSTEIDYSYALNGLTVKTSPYHPEVGRPPPPGMKYPSAFYEPSSINTVPAIVTETMNLHPDIYSLGRSVPVYEGSVIDILVQADIDVYWSLDKTDCLSFKVSGLDTSINPGPGLSLQHGMYYENTTTLIATGDSQITRHSTAMRVIALYGGNLQLAFNNYSIHEVTFTYSLWNAGQVIGYRDYYDQIDKTYESGKYTVEEILKMQYEMKLAFERQW